MKRLMVLVTLFGTVSLWILALQQAGSTPPGGVPAVTYLGEGGSYTIDPNQNFIVKRRPFGFDLLPGPAYTADAKEQVWSTTADDAPSAEYQTWVSFGEVAAGCVVEYQVIDDDPDERVNHFYINDAAVYELPQGMVSGGSFLVETAGVLKFYAADSVGLWVDSCASVVSPTPTPTLPPTATPTEEATIEPSVTATATLIATMTLTGTPPATDTPTTSPTPTATPTLPLSTRVITSTPTAPPPTEPSVPDTPTPTTEPRLNACLRINFEVGGDVARRGLYVVQEVGGRVLYSWWADEGWEDSGWIRDIDITFPAVYVQVFFYRGDGSEPVEMEIINPASGTTYGWLARGQCHAIEVAWPE